MFSLRRSILWICLSACFVLLAACRIDPPGQGESLINPYPTNRTPASTDIQYGRTPYQSQQVLDVYPAQSGQGSGVAIVYVHSGAWAAGDKTDADETPLLQYFMDQGHVVFSVNYTLAEFLCLGASPFPANLNDVKWAIAWANRAAQKSTYGYNKVVVMGASAGGQIAALATVTGDIRPGNMAATASNNVRPDAGMSFGGPSNMITFGAQGTAAQQQVQRNFLGINPVQCFWGVGNEHPNDVALFYREIASPASHVDSGDPPIFIASSISDPLALAAHNADVLEQAYTDIGSGFTLSAWNNRISGTGHNMDYLTNLEQADTFLRLVADGVL